jgi:hypothetical protein
LPPKRGEDRYYDAIVDAFLEACPEWRQDVTYLSVPGDTPDEPFLSQDGLKALVTWAYELGLVGHPYSLQEGLDNLEDQT